MITNMSTNMNLNPSTRIVLSLILSAFLVRQVCGDASERVVMLVVIAAAVAFVFRDFLLRSSPTSSSSQSSSPTSSSTDRNNGGVRTGLDPQLYTLRVVEAAVDSHRLVHLPARKGVYESLRRISRSYGRSRRGVVRRVTALLEDFYARIDTLTRKARDENRVAQSVQSLLDLRAEALNSLHTLTLSRPLALTKDVEEAREVVRDDTQRCLAQLFRRHRNTARLQKQDWKPPFAFDPSRDVNYSVHY
jgi:hypothetical protein